MRRCLHAFLVGVLSLALTTDTARACWYLRRACRVPRSCVVVCPPPRECGMVAVSDVVIDGWRVDATSASGCCCGTATIVTGDVVSRVEPTTAVAPAAPIAVESEPSGQPAAAPVTPPTEATPDATAARPSVAPPNTSLPTLEPTGNPVPDAVQQTTALTEEPQAEAPAEEAAEAEAIDSEDKEASAAEPAMVDAEPSPVDDSTEPAAEPAVEEPAPAEEEENPAEPVEPAEPAPAEPAPAEPALPVEPEEPNLFEEVEGGEPAVEPLDEATQELEDGFPPAAAAEPAVTEPAVTEPAVTEPAVTEDAVESDGEPGDAAAGEAPVVDEEAPAADDPAPPVDEPADEPLAEEESAPPADPFDGAGKSGEPLRRWIDRSGSFAVVAALVDVRADGTCVLGTAGRTLTVPLESLSDHDRGYAERAQQRLAARRAAEPEAGDTASM